MKTLFSILIMSRKILDGVSYEDFVNDIRIYYSVMKNIEIIGEAANMLSKDFIETHTELPWKQIIGMRHVLVHGYAQVSNVDLWDTARNDIDPLYYTHHSALFRVQN